MITKEEKEVQTIEIEIRRLEAELNWQKIKLAKANSELSNSRISES